MYQVCRNLPTFIEMRYVQRSVVRHTVDTARSLKCQVWHDAGMTRSDTFLGVPPFSLSVSSSHGRGDKKVESPSQAKLYVSVRRFRPIFGLVRHDLF